MIGAHSVSAIVTCAGRSVRFGSNKLLVDIDGRTVLETTVRQFVDHPMVDEVVVTVSEVHDGQYRRILDDAGLDVTVVIGGEERFVSAERGLDATTGSLILVHDGVRPFVTEGLITDALEAGSTYGAAMLGMPSVVQLKLVNDDEFVTSSLNRAHSWLGQTPQVFERELLATAYSKAIADGYALTSDDADLVAQYTGHAVKIIQGSEDNIKLTTPRDFSIAQHIARDRRP